MPLKKKTKEQAQANLVMDLMSEINEPLSLDQLIQVAINVLSKPQDYCENLVMKAIAAGKRFGFMQESNGFYYRIDDAIRSLSSDTKSFIALLPDIDSHGNILDGSRWAFSDTTVAPTASEATELGSATESRLTTTETTTEPKTKKRRLAMCTNPKCHGNCEFDDEEDIIAWTTNVGKKSVHFKKCPSPSGMPITASDFGDLPSSSSSSSDEEIDGDSDDSGNSSTDCAACRRRKARKAAQKKRAAARARGKPRSKARTRKRN